MIKVTAARAGFLAAAALAIGAVTAWACADPEVAPTWSLAKDEYDTGGSSALLTPGNDTRVNLMLLLADRRGEAVRDPAAAPNDPPLVLFPWRAMSNAAPRGATTPDQGWEPSRCQSNRVGAAGFVAALRANSGLIQEERLRLAIARHSFTPDCAGGAASAPAVAVQTPAGRAFASYLAAAGDFYAGRFPEARSRFAALAEAAPDPWIRETALYMVARSEINRAQLSSFDEYGWMIEPERRDLAAARAAGAGLEAYLSAYPNGRYASSARGLTRRAAWLAGDRQALAAAVDRQLASPGPFDGSRDTAALAEEIDHRLLFGETPPAPRDPLLLAVVDLQRMRCESVEEGREVCPERIDRAELERQAPLFAGEETLFGYLRASEAYYVRRAPREVISLIPNAARQARFTYLEFSRQVLRGLALDAVGDRNAREFWLSLFDGAVQPYQREALELALAIHDERAGNLERIFATDSRVRHPVIRQLLLEHSAGPDLLRRQASEAAAPKQERDVAAYILLAKELRHGMYRAFLEDVHLVPSGATVGDDYYSGAARYDAVNQRELPAPPLALFGPGAGVGEAPCPNLRSAVTRLAATPTAPGPQLCLAEFFRLNGFDLFPFDEPAGREGLGSGRSQFPGGPYHRLEVYKSVIADAAATPDERAFALNRAIRCYGPSGSNSCGGTEVPVSQRRAWFQRLKRLYPNSRWAQTLRYYW